MTDERRYGDDEVREIFDRASRGGEARGTDPVDEHGLTLAELQDVGRQVGLEPARIAEAAAALERRPEPVPARTLMGRPVSVGRIVELPRAPTDHEWEQIVAELRATFGAKGRTAWVGNLREWSNGNLHALVEPTPDGYRLRLQTVKGSALALRRVGSFGLALAAIGAAAFALQDRLDALTIPLLWAIIGAAALAAPMLTLPSWAREREQQMERVAERVGALLSD